MDEFNYWQRLSGQRLGRRALLRAGAIAAAGVSMAALAGCGNKGTTAGKATTGATSAGAGGGQPQRGGVISVKMVTDPPTTWMPAAAATYNSIWPMAPAYNQLVQWDPQDQDNKIIPDLADSYEIAGDGRSIVFKLHAGVKFHDGADFSSEDVKATFDWTRNPPPKQVSTQQGILQVIDRVETPDPLTAKLVLKAPSPSLIFTLATHYGCMGAKADLTRDNLNTIVNGTGPFKLKAFTRGVGVEMERNPNYWVKDRPYMDGVKHLVLPDENTAMTDFLAGRVHRFFPVLPDNIVRVEKETGGKAKVYTPVAANRTILFFNGTKKPFNDPRVRQAVSLVLDRQEVQQIVENGVSLLGGYMMPGGRWAISTDQVKKVAGYDKPDIAEAKKLLAAAGVTQPLTGTLMTRSDPTFQPATIWIQGTLKKVLGWDYKIDVKNSAEASAAAATTQFDLCHWRYGLTIDDPDATYGQLLTSKAASNWSRIFDPDADVLYDKQSQMLDAAQRKQLVQQLELKYLNNFPQLTLYFLRAAHGLWDVIQNYKLTGGIFVNQRYQDVWLSKA